MNKLLFFGATVLLFTACGDKSNTINFNLAYSCSTTITASFGSNIPFEVKSSNVVTDIQTEANINKTEPQLITSVTAIQLQVLVTSPAGSNFDYLKDMSLYIEAEGQPKKLIGKLTELTEDGSAIKTLTIENAADLSPSELLIKGWA